MAHLSLNRRIASAGMLTVMTAAAALTPAAARAATDWENVDPSGQQISFWYQFTGPKRDAMDALIKQFNDTNTWHITVTGSYQGNYGDVEKKVLPLLGTSAMPDMTVAYQNQVVTYMQANAVLPLDSLVDSVKWGLSKSQQDDFIKGIWESDLSPVYNNARLGLATQRSVQVMYYNADWLKELGADAPPKTPEAFRALACAAAKEGDGKTGFMMETDPSNMAGWAYAYGGDIFDASKSAFTFTDPALEKSMTFVQGLVKDGCAVLQPTDDGDMAAFGQQKALFTLGSSSSMSYYAKTVSDGGNFAWAVASMPYTTDKPVANVYGASFSLLNSGDDRRELATWLFLKYLAEAKQQADWSEHSGYLPTLHSATAAMGDYFKANPDYAVAFGLLDGKSEPGVPGYDLIRDEMEKTMAAIYAGAPVDAALAQLNEDANKEFKEQLADLNK